MEKKTIGIVISANKQWWLKVNTKAFRMHALDGAIFPYIIKVKYEVNGKSYICKKWISAGLKVPEIGSKMTVLYRDNKPSKARVQENSDLFYK